MAINHLLEVQILELLSKQAAEVVGPQQDGLSLDNHKFQL